VYSADSTGFGLPESLKAQFPGAGGSGSKAGAKIQLVWEYKSHTFDHFALIPWNVPDSKYVDTVVALAQAASLFLFDLGYFKLTAFAAIAAAHAYFLSRLNHQTTLREVIGGRQQALDLARALAQEPRPLLEKAVVLGAYERIPTRLIAIRMPEAIVNERRRQAYVAAKKAGYTPSQTHLTLLAWNLFITNVPTTVWSTQTVGIAYSLRWQVELVFRAWKSGLHLATVTTTTKHSTLCYLYGRMLLILLTSALSSPLRTTIWQQHRELSLFKLVRHFQASADLWLQRLFQSPLQLSTFLSRLCATAERLVRKAVRKRPTSAQRLRESLGAQVDFFEPALTLAA
jgi:DDE family transposase